MKKQFTSQAGFTFIEVIVVILLLGIAAALVLPRGLATATNHAALDAQAQQLAGLVRLARAKAMAEGTDYKVVIEGSSCSLKLGSGAATRDKGSGFIIDKQVRFIPQPPLGKDIVFRKTGLPEGGGGTIKLETKGGEPESLNLIINELGMAEISR